MKRLLKRFVAFLDRKWPDRVEITEAEYNQLYEQLGAYNRVLQDFDKRINALALGVEALNKPQEGLTELKEKLAAQAQDVQKCKDEISKLHIVMGFTSGRGQAPLER